MYRDDQIIFEWTVLEPGNKCKHPRWCKYPSPWRNLTSSLPIPCEPKCKTNWQFVILGEIHQKVKIKFKLIAFLILIEIESKHMFTSLKCYKKFLWLTESVGALKHCIFYNTSDRVLSFIYLQFNMKTTPATYDNYTD